MSWEELEYLAQFIYKIPRRIRLTYPKVPILGKFMIREQAGKID